MEQNKSNAGRKRMEGGRHMYKIAEDAHMYIMQHGGGQWLTDTVRAIMESASENGILEIGAACPLHKGLAVSNYCKRCQHFEEQPGAFCIVCGAAKKGGKR